MKVFDLRGFPLNILQISSLTRTLGVRRLAVCYVEVRLILDHGLGALKCYYKMWQASTLWGGDL